MNPTIIANMLIITLIETLKLLSENLLHKVGYLASLNKKYKLEKHAKNIYNHAHLVFNIVYEFIRKNNP